MVHAIRGTVSDPSNPTTAMAYLKVNFALDVGLEFDDDAAGSSSVPRWTTYTDGSGLFRFLLSEDDVEEILEYRRHRELIFKVFDSSDVLLGIQSVYVSRAILRGTETVSLAVNSTYTLPGGIGVPNFAVAGFVTDAEGNPSVGVTVELNKKTLRNLTSLGSAETGDDGGFLIRYAGSAGEHSDRATFSVELAASSVSATAGHFCNPPANLTVRLVEDDETYRGQSDYDLDLATINPLLDSATLDELEVEDVEFLMCRTQHDSGALATLVRAHALADQLSLPAAAFAAFAYAGIPLSTNELTSLDAGAIAQAIQHAIDASAVPASLADDLATITSALASARTDRIVPASDPDSTTLGSILVAAALTTGLPRQFAELYVAHTGTAAEFWTALRAHEDFGDSVVDKIQFTLQVGALSANYPPLVKLLHAKRDANIVTRAAELAQYDADDWVGFLDETVDGDDVDTPSGVAGADESARRANYAGAIARMVADLYPSAHLSYRVPQSAVTTTVADLAAFVVQNPDFSYQRTNIAEFFPTAAGLPADEEDREALRQDLLRVQRISAITPRYSRSATAVTLLEAGITSAGQIQRMGFAAFKAKFGEGMSVADLAATYDRADQVASAALTAFFHMRRETHFPLTAVMVSPGCGDVDLEALFGNLDYCSCRHCESVYGPAAYFVDIMQFLKVRDVGDGTLLDVLLLRRPELAKILLNCANSDTVLPTIDLVAETLERRARVPLGLEASTDFFQTTWTTPELIARPEHVDTAVYERLADHQHAYFPHNLPFDLPLAEARAYLLSLGASCVALQDNLEWFDGLDEDDTFRVDERLGLSPGQGAIVRGAEGTKPLKELWGFTDEEDWVDQINGAELFLERAGLELPGLLELLRCRILADVDLEYDEPCTLKGARLVQASNHELAGLSTNRLAMLQRFLRLRAALGWTAPELDATLQVLDTWFDPEQLATELQTIAHLVRVRQSFPQLAHGEVLTWFGPLDRHEYAEGGPSFYDTVISPRLRDDAFTALDGSTDLGDVRGDLLAILQLDAAGLAAAYAATGLGDGSSLTLAHLSTLYRVASIARAVGLTAPELVILTRYTQTLHEGSPGPFAGAPDAPVRELLDVAQAVKTSGFTVAELDWILRDQRRDEFGAGDLDVTRTLIGLITSLQRADLDDKRTLPPDDALQSDIEKVEKLLTLVLPAAKIDDALKFILKETDPAPDAGQAAAIRAELFFFLANNTAAWADFGKIFAEADDAAARTTAVLTELPIWLRRQRLERTVVQQLATALGLDPADADLLLRTYTQGSDLALTLLTADAFFAKTSFDSTADASKLKEPDFPKDFLNRTAVSGCVDLYRGLRKVAHVATTFRFSPGLLGWVLAHRDDPDVTILDLTALPDGSSDAAIYAAYAGWDWLRRAIRSRDELLRGPGDFTALLDLFFSTDFDKSSALSALALAAGWDPDTLADFEASETITQAELKSLEAVEAFAAAFRLGARLGVAPETARTWAKLSPIVADDAVAIRGAAEAKLGASWPSVAQPIRDRLRMAQRDALVDLLLHKTGGVKDRDDLFGELLMDVDIACCNRTTRLLFATGAVQLFMQRALMGLESAEEVDLSDLDADEWSWMRRYRVWEANRKIFLYPENWVLPELRTDKTPLFKKLEEEIAQGEADDASVEQAYIHYLEGLHEVARLDVCGMYQELEHDSTIDRMHVFARTHGEPSKVFYRRREDDAYWTAWEELPFAIEPGHVLPLVANRRLMLLWAKVELRADEPTKAPQQGEPAALPPKHRKVRLMWTEYKDGEWSAVQTSDSSVRINYWEDMGAAADGPTPNWDVTLTSRVEDDSMVIGVRRIWTAKYGDNVVSSAHRMSYFTYDACLGRFVGHVHEELREEATGAFSLNGTYPVPYVTTSWRQSFHSENNQKKYDNGLFAVRLPIPAGVGQHYAYSPKLLNPRYRFGLLLPRQEHILDARRPFFYSDDKITLYMRRDDEADPVTDAHPNKQSVQTMGQPSLIPYFAFTDGKFDAVTLPKNAGLTLQIKGGEGPAAQQQLLPNLDIAKGPLRYGVSLFYHPYACLFLQQTRRFGVAGLLDPSAAAPGDDDDPLLYQQASEALPASYFDGVTAVSKPIPAEDVDFLYGGAYSVYNWELFYHIPMYIADRLMTERRFAEAQRWLGYIFNPIRRPGTVSETDCKFYWRIKPFRKLSAKMSIEDLLELLHYTGSDATLKAEKANLIDQIARWREDPFRPHDVARLRPTAYMRAVVMKYLDNLIAWGDDLFRQDTRESTQEAAQLYFLALQILGKRPREVDGDERPDKDWDDAVDDLDAFSNFLVDIENDVLEATKKSPLIPLDLKAQADVQFMAPTTLKLGYVQPAQAQLLIGAIKAKAPKPKPPFNPLPFGTPTTTTEQQLYFCIPPNDKLLGYWDTVADRLFKLRNCLNIEGIRRDLALFDPPIDPGLLAKAAAQGVDIGTAIGNLYAPLPHYRFLPHLGIAKDFAAQVTSLGSALLQALEKRDAEALAVLRSGHEVALLKVVRQVKEKAVAEAEANIQALTKSREVAAARETYYKTRERMNKGEKAELGLTIAAAVLDIVGGAFVSAGGVASAVPMFHLGISGYAGSPVVVTQAGGSQLGGGLAKTGQALNIVAGSMQRSAGVLGTQASYTRRKEEWDFQKDLATRDITQIDAQISAAEIRLAMAKHELANHYKQVEQSSEALEAMQSKFTNAELYGWMAGELSKVHHLAYELAIDLARRAERCYRYELAVEGGDDFIQFGHWDNRRQGLLAGERLQNDLRRMEAAFYQNHRREYELTKRVSLAALDPVALIALRKTGACHFQLPAILFNLDHASHYLRRIKLVGVSVPAVAGPFTGVGVTLTYEAGKIRKTAGGGPVDAEGPAQSVAISVTQEDTGLFEPNLRDERYLPFEGRALEDSRWRLELPAKVRQFDYETISDVVLTIRYTAREGGTTTKDAVGALDTALDAIARPDGALNGAGQVHVFSARAEFPEAWRSFVAAGHGGGETDLVLDLSEQRFPHPQLPPGSRTIEYVAVFARWPADASVAPSSAPFGSAELQPPTGDPIALPAFSKYKPNDPVDNGPPKNNYLWYANTDDGLAKAPGTWTLHAPSGWPDEKSPEDIIIVVAHKVA